MAAPVATAARSRRRHRSRPPGRETFATSTPKSARVAAPERMREFGRRKRATSAALEGHPMRLVTISHRRAARWPISWPNHRVAVMLPSGRYLPLGSLAVLLARRSGRARSKGWPLSTVACPGPGHERDPPGAGSGRTARPLEAAAVDPATSVLAPPIPRPGKIVGVGYNYLDHIREQGLERPARPVLFSDVRQCRRRPTASRSGNRPGRMPWTSRPNWRS